jgi:hypothetical protein
MKLNVIRIVRLWLFFPSVHVHVTPDQFSRTAQFHQYITVQYLTIPLKILHYFCAVSSLKFCQFLLFPTASSKGRFTDISMFVHRQFPVAKVFIPIVVVQGSIFLQTALWLTHDQRLHKSRSLYFLISWHCSNTCFKFRLIKNRRHIPVSNRVLTNPSQVPNLFFQPYYFTTFMYFTNIGVIMCNSLVSRFAVT